MDVNFLTLYLDLNKTLIKTMTIKSAISANVMNDFIRLRYGSASVDDHNPETWKYYLNISGAYHLIDTPMYVTSLDTLDEILFSKENLAIHTATAEGYQYGTRYYYSLIKKYPDQEQLIMGILYPVNLQKAVVAENGSILGYPSKLIEPQEITLIEDLEGFIKRYLVRWDVTAFGLSDSLYNSAQHAIMYLNLLPALLNYRLARCKTNEVHSFHIKNYLASHGNLDKYMPYMTLKQALFLYRNMRHIERNSGKVEQFKKLIEKMLSDRHIPLSEFSVRHLAQFDNKHYPEITVRKKPVNIQYNVPEKDYFDVSILYDKERPLAYGNPVYLDSNNDTMTYKFKNHSSSVIQTKDLESSMVDYNDAVPDTLEAVLMRQWAYMSSKGLYNAVINFKDPATFELKALRAADAFIYMLYINLKSIGINIVNVPNFVNIKYRRHPKPSLSNLLSVVDSRFTDIPAIASSMLQSQPIISQCNSSTQFFNMSHKVYEEAQKHWFITSNIGDSYKRANVANMFLKLYADEKIVFTTPVTGMAEWLASKNLPAVYDYTYDEAQKLVVNLFTGSTGLTIDTSTLLVNIQKAMIAIMTQLSSYSIQFISYMNPSKIIPLNWAAIRPGNLERDAGAYYEVNNGIYVIDTVGGGAKDYPIEAVSAKDFYYAEQSASISKIVNTEITVFKTIREIKHYDVNFNSFRLTADYPLYDASVSNDAKFIGWEYYLALDTNQQSQLKSIYQG